MNPWPFVAAAYAVALGGAGVLAALSFLAMRRAERAAERGRGQGRGQGRLQGRGLGEP